MTAAAIVLAGRGEVQRAAENLVNSQRAQPSRVDVIRLADVAAEPVKWLWPGYLPVGKLAILEGDPGLGKSTLTMAMAAAVTGGPPLPGTAKQAAAPAVIVTYEDGIADTVRPRLAAAGGNPDMVYAIRAVNDMPVTIPDHVPEIASQVASLGARLVVIDPAGAAFSRATDTYVDSDVRRALAPLAQMAEDMQATVLIVRHLRKATRLPALMSGAASIGIAAAARVVLGVYRDPSNPEQCVLAIVKSNLAQQARSLGFRLHNTEAGVARIEWTGACAMSADDLVASRDIGSDGEPQSTRSTLSEAADFLIDILGENAELASKTVICKGRDAGYTTRTIQRAARRVGVVVRREGRGEHHHTLWRLPLHSRQVHPES